jgi:hypothetical protein
MKKLLTVLCAAAAVASAGCRDGRAIDAASAGSPAGTSQDSVTLAAGDGLDSAGVVAAGHVRALTPSEIAGRAPAQLRGIYLNAYAAGSTNRLSTLLALADTTEINTFVIDVKDERGIRYRSEIELAMELAQPGEVTIRDLAALAERLRERGIWSMARIVVFKDPILAAARPEWTIRRPDGGTWIDREGNTWVSTWEPAVWDYNIRIAEEVARAGFDEIQFDYIRFPEAYRSLPEQIHPKAKGDRTDAIAAFLDEARRRLHPLGAVVAADVFGLSPNDPRDVAIGQQWETVLAKADHILPMVYPSHYFPTHLRGVSRPNRMPYETVFTSLGIGMVRWNRLQEAGVRPARVIPWLQAFNAPWVDRDFPYGPEQAAAQIRAVYDVGLEDWVFWHPGSRYEQIAAAFARETTSRRQPFTPSADFVSQADLLDRQGARAARDAAAGTAPAPAATGSGPAGSGPTGTAPAGSPPAPPGSRP